MHPATSRVRSVRNRSRRSTPFRSQQPEWCAWARGPKGECVEGRGASPKDVLLELTGRLKGVERVTAKCGVVAMLVALLVVGCSLARVERCTLELTSVAGEVLERPYVVEMVPTPLLSASADVMYEASGWTGEVAIRATAPSGPKGGGGIDAPTLNGDRAGQNFDEPGLWRVELEDDAGCLQRLEIEVHPPVGLAP